MAFPTSGCVAYYKLNEAAGATRNDSVGTNNLTDHNTVGSSAGKIANAADFVSASSQYLSHADATAYQMGTGNFSMSLWCKYGTTGAADVGLCWYGEYSNPSYGMYLTNGPIAAAPVAKIFDGSSGKTAGGSTRHDDNNWHFCVMTCDRAAGITLYVDNVSENPFVGALPAGSVNNATGGFNVGAIFVSGAIIDFLNGSVDEIGLWNRVLTAGELTTLWNGGAGLTFPVASAVQRRTLSSLGTRTGSRQLQCY